MLVKFQNLWPSNMIIGQSAYGKCYTSENLQQILWRGRSVFEIPFKATHFIATQLELAVETLKISRFLYVFNL